MAPRSRPRGDQHQAIGTTTSANARRALLKRSRSITPKPPPSLVSSHFPNGLHSVLQLLLQCPSIKSLVASYQLFCVPLLTGPNLATSNDLHGSKSVPSKPVYLDPTQRLVVQRKSQVTAREGSNGASKILRDLIHVYTITSNWINRTLSTISYQPRRTTKDPQNIRQHCHNLLDWFEKHRCIICIN